MKIMKKLLTAVIIAAMLVTVFAVSASAATVKEIATEADFAAMGESGRYKLTADITLTQPLKSFEFFEGELDGAGHKITGYTSDKAMFEYVDITAVIKNITFENMTVVTTGNKVSGFVDINLGILFNLKFVNLTVTGPTTDVGGVVNENKGTIENVTATMKLTGAGDRAAGIAIRNRANSTIRYCFVYGELTTNFHIGAIASHNQGLVENCINYATITARQSRAGGIVGTSTEGSTLKNCINYGTVIAYRDGAPENVYAAAAGITNCEKLPYTVENCVNAGKIITSKINNVVVGGALAYAKEPAQYVVNCYTLDNVFYRYSDNTFTAYSSFDMKALEETADYKGFNGTMISEADLKGVNILDKVGAAFVRADGDYPLLLAENTSKEPVADIKDEEGGTTTGGDAVIETTPAATTTKAPESETTPDNSAATKAPDKETSPAEITTVKPDDTAKSGCGSFNPFVALAAFVAVIGAAVVTVRVKSR